jgi:glucosamine-6-phosphate deaminase
MSHSPIRIRVFENPDSASAQVAAEISLLIRERALIGSNAVIGFGAGITSLPLFEELVYLNREEGLSFRNVVSFNVGEFLGLPSDHPGSARAVMNRQLFDKVDIHPDNIHLLSSDLTDPGIAEHCKAYEEKIARKGGIDLMVFGIGRSGGIGYNQPGAAADSRTGRVLLNEITREDSAVKFDKPGEFPTHALTMGCATILSSQRIIGMAWGANKARVVRRAIEDPVSRKTPASYLRHHKSAQIFLDQASASVIRRTT